MLEYVLIMQDLEECFNCAIESNAVYIAVKIQMQGFSEPEIIINTNPNFKEKLEYYKKSYNTDLTLKTFKGIKIIDFCCANSFDEIEFVMMDDEVDSFIN